MPNGSFNSGENIEENTLIIVKNDGAIQTKWRNYALSDLITIQATGLSYHFLPDISTTDIVQHSIKCTVKEDALGNPVVLNDNDKD